MQIQRDILRFFLVFSLLCSSLFSLEKANIIHIPISGDIDMGLPHYIERGIELAHSNFAKLIIFEIDTFGGRIDAATKIKDLILNSDIETIAFINKRAISAGALISLSCDKIFITDGGTIGAATAVNSQGEKASEKVISYMREEMASTAEAHNRSRKIAEAMVDENIAINFIIGINKDTIKSDIVKGFQDGKLITLSTKHAINLGIADGKFETVEDIIESYGISDFQIISIKETWTESLVRFLTNPNVAPLLMSLGMIGLFFEIKSPGFGVPGGLGLLCLGLFFGAHLLVGLANFFELLVLMLGVILILIEIILIPGFGIFGLSGLGLIIYSLYSMLIGDYPTPKDIEIAYRSLTISIVSGVVLSMIFFKLLIRSDFYKKLIPIQSQKSIDGYTILKISNTLIGKEGVSITDLRPSGKILINTKSYQAISEGNYIENSSDIVVVGIDENQFIVKKV